MKNQQKEIKKLKHENKIYFFEGLIIFIFSFLILYTANLSSQLKEFLMLISLMFFLLISFLILFSFNILMKLERKQKEL